jgi:cellulose synthase/poly-beta-1,6-N-acetylglucosamine synthase-like glycosyltransferase
MYSVTHINYGQYLLISLFCVVYNVSFVTYLTYKTIIIKNNWTDTLKHPWLLVVLGCEFMYFLSSFISMIQSLIPPSKRPSLRLNDDGPFPNIDIFITCCKEDIDVIKDTLLAALKQNYPKNKYTIYMLDDGKDGRLELFVNELVANSMENGDIINLKYLSREKKKGIPHHFKAGNINFGLANSSSEFIVILDADMIIHNDFLRYVLPHIMNTEDVAYVQTPQGFYNIKKGDILCDAQPMWYHNVLLHRDTINSPSCCGTGVMFRRSALNSIGGFKVESITEDALTSIYLLHKGYKAVYLNHKLQMGLTPWTFKGYLAQRDRWARGALQLIHKTLFQVLLNPMSNLTLYKRLMYFWYFGNYIIYIVNVVLLTTFLLILGLNLKSFPGSDDDGRRLLFFITPVIVSWRFYWVLEWKHIPNAFQQRNREEQQFWWITPYMCEMIFSWMFSCFNKVNFTSTGSIDGKRSAFKYIYNIWVVKWHLLCSFGIPALVLYRLYRLDLNDCKEVIFVLGISLFLLLIAIYMFIPVYVVLFMSSISPEERHSLLIYDSQGVPLFDAKRTVPELDIYMLIYEFITWMIPVAWIVYFIISYKNVDVKVCEDIRNLDKYRIKNNIKV